MADKLAKEEITLDQISWCHSKEMPCIPLIPEDKYSWEVMEKIANWSWKGSIWQAEKGWDVVECRMMAMTLYTIKKGWQVL